VDGTIVSGPYTGAEITLLARHVDLPHATRPQLVTDRGDGADPARWDWTQVVRRAVGEALAAAGVPSAVRRVAAGLSGAALAGILTHPVRVVADGRDVTITLRLGDHISGPGGPRPDEHWRSATVVVRGAGGVLTRPAVVLLLPAGQVRRPAAGTVAGWPPPERSRTVERVVVSPEAAARLQHRAAAAGVAAESFTAALATLVDHLDQALAGGYVPAADGRPLPLRVHARVDRIRPLATVTGPAGPVGVHVVDLSLVLARAAGDAPGGAFRVPGPVPDAQAVLSVRPDPAPTSPADPPVDSPADPGRRLREWVLTQPWPEEDGDGPDLYADPAEWRPLWAELRRGPADSAGVYDRFRSVAPGRAGGRPWPEPAEILHGAAVPEPA
jgi:hypothetical protein